MQRQSLGSPVSKLYGSHGGAVANSDEAPADDQKRNKHSPSPSILNYDEQDDDKDAKSFRFHYPSSSPTRHERLVHAIPVLTVICFLILYICSHSPSQSDLAQFHGFKRPSEHLDFKGDGDDLIMAKKGNVLAIQSTLRNLKEIEKSHSLIKSRPPRKLADF